MNAPDSDAADRLEVDVIMAWPDRVLSQRLALTAGTTLHELRHHPSLRSELRQAWSEAVGVGVFGQKLPLRTVLRPGDRVELWRPLAADPKEARRLRAKLKNAKG